MRLPSKSSSIQDFSYIFLRHDRKKGQEKEETRRKTATDNTNDLAPIVEHDLSSSGHSKYHLKPLNSRLSATSTDSSSFYDENQASETIKKCSIEEVHPIRHKDSIDRLDVQEQSDGCLKNEKERRNLLRHSALGPAAKFSAHKSDNSKSRCKEEDLSRITEYEIADIDNKYERNFRADHSFASHKNPKTPSITASQSMSSLSNLKHSPFSQGAEFSSGNFSSHAGIVFHESGTKTLLGDIKIKTTSFDEQSISIASWINTISEQYFRNRNANFMDFASLRILILRGSKIYIFKPATDCNIRAFISLPPKADLKPAILDENSAAIELKTPQIDYHSCFNPNSFSPEIRNLFFTGSRRKNIRTFLPSTLALYEYTLTTSIGPDYEDEFDDQKTKNLELEYDTQQSHMPNRHKLAFIFAYYRLFILTRSNKQHDEENYWQIDSSYQIENISVIVGSAAVKFIDLKPSLSSSPFVLKIGPLMYRIFVAESTEIADQFLQNFLAISNSSEAFAGLPKSPTETLNSTKSAQTYWSEKVHPNLLFHDIRRDAKPFSGTLESLCHFAIFGNSSCERSSKKRTQARKTFIDAFSSSIGLYCPLKIVLNELIRLCTVLNKGDKAARIVRNFLSKSATILLDLELKNLIIDLVRKGIGQFDEDVANRYVEQIENNYTVLKERMIIKSQPANENGRIPPQWNIANITADFTSLETISSEGLTAEFFMELSPNLAASQIHLFHAQRLLKIISAGFDFGSISLCLNKNEENCNIVADFYSLFLHGEEQIHFLTCIIYSHILEIGPLARRTLPDQFKAMLLSKWILIGQSCWIQGDANSYMAIATAVCSPAIARLQNVWKRINESILDVVRHKFIPDVLETEKQYLSANKTDKLVLHAESSVSIEPIPYCGNLYAFLKRKRAQNSKNIHVADLQSTSEIIGNALDSVVMNRNIQESIQEPNSRNAPHAEPHLQHYFARSQREFHQKQFQDIFSNESLIKASKRCFKTFSYELIDCIKNRRDDLFEIGAYAPTMFYRVLNSYEIFEANELLGAGHFLLRKSSASSLISASSGGNYSLNSIDSKDFFLQDRYRKEKLRRSLSYPPTQGALSNVHKNVDQAARKRIAGLSSRNSKLLRTLRDFAGIGESPLHAVDGSLVLKKSLKPNNRDSKTLSLIELASKVSKDVKSDEKILESDYPTIQLSFEDLNFTKIQKVVCKAGTIERLVDLLIVPIRCFNILFETESPCQEMKRRDTLALDMDREEYLKTFFTTYRNFCTPEELIDQLIFRLERVKNAFPTFGRRGINFPDWKGLGPLADFDHSLSYRVIVNILKVFAYWTENHSLDFMENVHMNDKFRKFVALMYENSHDLKTEHQQNSIETKIENEDLKNESKEDVTKENELEYLLNKCINIFAEKIHLPSFVAKNTKCTLEQMRRLTLVTPVTPEIAEDVLDDLDNIVRCAFSQITTDDWLNTFKILQVQSTNPLGFFPEKQGKMSTDENIVISDIILFCQKLKKTDSDLPLWQAFPSSIQTLFKIYQSIYSWANDLLVDPSIQFQKRVCHIRLFLRILKLSCQRMSSLDLVLNGETDEHGPRYKIPSLVAHALCYALISPESRLFCSAWVEATGQTNIDVSLLNESHCATAESMTQESTACEPVPKNDRRENVATKTAWKAEDSTKLLSPSLSWILERFLELCCYIPDHANSDSKIINFDKYRYVYNLVSHIRSNYLTEPAEQNGKVIKIENNQNESSRIHFTARQIREAAISENIQFKARRPVKPFNDLVQWEIEKIKRDWKQRDNITKILRESARDSRTGYKANSNDGDQHKKPGGRSRFGASFLRAVRPLSIAFGRTTSNMKVVHPQELPTSAYISSGTKLEMTFDLISSTARLVTAYDLWNLICLRSENGVEIWLQASDALSASRLIKLCAATSRATDLIPDRNSSINTGKKGGKKAKHNCYGVSLTSLYERNKQEVPKILSTLIDEIESRGLVEEGLYRVPGAVSTINLLKTQFDNGANICFSDVRWSDTNALAGALKLWIRELPEPIIPYKSYESFLKVTDISDHNERNDYLRRELKKLPTIHYKVLKRIIEHLDRVTAFEETNHMYAHNLAIVFGANLMQPLPDQDSFLNSMKNLGKAQNVIKTLILEFSALFMDQIGDEDATDVIVSVKREDEEMIAVKF